MAKVGISLGANLGDRLAHFREALERLDPARSTPHLLVSGVYETDPVDCPPDSPPFLNAVLEIETSLSPDDLLEFTRSIEVALGRPSERNPNAPRPLDLDLLYYDDLVLETPSLTLPHPRMRERAFVLLPLREIRPDLARSAPPSEQGVRRLDLDWASPCRDADPDP